MSIEDTQRLVDTITLGAQQAAAGASAGLNLNQTVDASLLKKEQLRAAQRQQYAERNMRAGNMTAAQQFLAENDAQYQFVGQPVDENQVRDQLEVIAGENPEDLIEEGGLVKKNNPARYESLRRALNQAKAEGNSRKAAFIEGKLAEAVDAQKAFDFGLVGMGDNAVVDSEGIAISPYRGQSNETQRMYAKEDREEGQAAKLKEERRFRGDLNPYEIDQEIAKQLRKYDDQKAVPISLRSNIAEEILARRERGVAGGPELVGALNDAKAEAEARDIAATPLGRSAAFGEENIGRIQEVRAIKPVKGAKDGALVQVVVPDDPIAYEQAVRMVDREGQTVGYADEAGSQLGDANFSDTSNNLNAPQLPRAQSWAQQSIDSEIDRSGGLNKAGDDIGSVDIMGTLRGYTDRLNQMGYGTAMNTEPRSMAEFEKSIDFIINKSEQAGKSLYSFDPETGKNTVATSPGIDEVLNAMRYTPAERANLAKALLIMGKSEESGVNAARKADFAARKQVDTPSNVVFDALGEDTPLARVGNEKIGRGKNQRNVKGELAKLSDPDAAKPFIGAVAGEQPARAAFIRGSQRNKSTAELEKQFGPKNARIAKEVENRYNADQERAAQPPKPDSFAQEQRLLDERFAREGNQAEVNMNRAELAEMARLVGEGKLAVPADSEFNRNKFRRENREGMPMGIPAGNRILMADGGMRAAGGRMPENAAQPIQQAAAPMSIAPSPGDYTGSQPAPAVDAGRGGWMGGGGSGRIVNPYAPEPEDEGRPLTTGLREELNNLQPTKSRSRGYMVSPDGPTKERERREVTKGLQRENTRKRFGYGAAGSGVAAGLAALIGGEREAREEEVMV